MYESDEMRVDSKVLFDAAADSSGDPEVSYRSSSGVDSPSQTLTSEADPTDEALQREPFEGIVGGSAELRSVLEHVELVAPTHATVLVMGETGTGKELIGCAIHSRSSRRHAPFVRVNCASIPTELFESEFFGHAKGSFTGAFRERIGRFQSADGGTLFLDEVGEIPLAHQPKLLRVLQEGQFERVGEDITRNVNVRIVAATNRDLRQEVADGRFREDLYYRLSVFPIKVPPLRERKEDIAALAMHFVARSCERLGRPRMQLEDDDIAMLEGYDWPGNIRQLQNVIERAVIPAKGPRPRFDLAFAHVGSGACTGGAASGENKEQGAPARIIRSDDLSKLERENILAALEFARWKISGPGGAAEILGINPSTLASRMRTMGIRRSRTE
jgi:transcriptional regulator with GAF, ATPase, and Fis domain